MELINANDDPNAMMQDDTVNRPGSANHEASKNIRSMFRGFLDEIGTELRMLRD